MPRCPARGWRSSLDLALPFHQHPDRFVDLVEHFIDTTPLAQHDQELLRELLRCGPDGQRDHCTNEACILLDAPESDERSAT